MVQAPDYPRQEDMALPILRCIAELGGWIVFSTEGSVLEQRLADHYSLTDEQRTRTDPSVNAKGHRVWRNHIQYARLKLKQWGLLDASERDVWAITPKGYDWLARQQEWNWTTTTVHCAVDNHNRAIPLISDVEESTFPEGQAKYSLHRKLERDNQIVQIAKQKRLRQDGCLCCDVCGFDFFRIYGPIGEGFIEAHHTTPVSELDGKTTTKLSDLALVCCNCHRILHRKRPWLSIDALREILAERAARIKNTSFSH